MTTLFCPRGRRLVDCGSSDTSHLTFIYFIYFIFIRLGRLSASLGKEGWGGGEGGAMLYDCCKASVHLQHHQDAELSLPDSESERMPPTCRISEDV